jgi:hypothetical protein
MSRKSALLCLSLSAVLVGGCAHKSAQEPAAAPKPITIAPPPTTQPSKPMMTAAATQPPVDWEKLEAAHPVIKSVRAGGVQIYECKKGDKGFAWVLKAPEAILYDEKGRPIGKHYGGPTWEVDGVKIVGEQRIASKTQPSAIPLLFLSAKVVDGTGPLAGTKFVERTATSGGVKPATPADEAHAGKEERISYLATYVFYAGS